MPIPTSNGLETCMTTHTSDLSLRRRRPIDVLQRQEFLVRALRILGLLTVVWGELGSYLSVLWTCRWPDDELRNGADVTHVLLIADPQVRFPLHAIESDASWFGEFLYDTNLRKNWYAARHMKPDLVIFLGDMLASGKYAKEQAEFSAYVQKFHSIFKRTSEIPMYFTPGNNDIGMGTSPSMVKPARHHYVEHFGHFNQHLTVRNHSFVILDAPGLVDEDYQRYAQQLDFSEWDPLPQGPIEFVKDIKEARDGHRPTILFSHIPLARPDVASCGPLRERGTIHRNPSIVFSGDNRDYCDYVHLDPEGRVPSVREVTVKSFSPSPHILRPGFQLLSLTTPHPAESSTTPSFADSACLLPNQNAIYSGPYLFLAVIAFFAVLVTNIHRVHQQRKHPLSPISLTRTRRNGDPSPTMQPPDSGIWSPYTPTTPYSPMSKFPPMRTPNLNNTEPTTMRTASNPSSPFGTPMLSPMLTPSFDEDSEEDSMYVSQYALDMGLTEADEERHILSSLKSPILPSSLSGNRSGWRTTKKNNV
ncbi:hypothetical protein ONZ45_g12884 [Pleurotus djamor]|nr:hypothetical protein ONZ45_g12884 [Pleurotus djamor]